MLYHTILFLFLVFKASYVQRPTDVTTFPSSSVFYTLDGKPTYPIKRPCVTSIMNLLGKWLIRGALTRVKFHGVDIKGTVKNSIV